MEIIYYSLSELRNMKYPNQWIKRNKEDVIKKTYNKHLSVPIVAEIEGKKVPHILSEFEYIASEFSGNDNGKQIPCIFYSNITREEAINLLSAQADRRSSMDEIRTELELLTSEEKKILQFYAAFNVDENEFFSEINTRYEGQMRKITARSLHNIYDKSKLDEVFKPLNLELSKQFEVLTAYTSKIVGIIDDERMIPKITLIRYLWSIFEAVLDLMKNEQIAFNSPEFDELLKDINEQVIKNDIEKIIAAFNAEANTYSIANKHKKKITSLGEKSVFNPFVF